VSRPRTISAISVTILSVAALGLFIVSPATALMFDGERVVRRQ